MSNNHERALQYVINTNGGATVENFIEDFEPVGQILWDELVALHLVTIDNKAKIHVLLQED